MAAIAPTGTRGSGQPPAGTAEELRRLVRDCVLGGVERNALWLRLAALPTGWSKPHHLRLAYAALEPLLHAERAQSFRLADEGLVVVWRGDAQAGEQACRVAIGHLFAGAEVIDPEALVRQLRLPADAPILHEAIDLSERARPPPSPPQAAGVPLDATRLARLEAMLAQADVARFARRRDVCAIDGRGRFALRWEKRYLSVAELTATLAPDWAIQADPWLFRRLSRTLDQRMLALLSAPQELHGAGPFSLNLNVSSILAPEFLRFDAALPAALRGHVILDLSPPDVLADPAAFRFARDFAHARRYRLLLRGVGVELVGVLTAAAFGIDLLQLRWSPDLEACKALPGNPCQLVLGRAGGAEAIGWGQSLGITLFQGARVVRGAIAADADPAHPSRSPPASRNLALGGASAPS